MNLKEQEELLELFRDDTVQPSSCCSISQTARQAKRSKQEFEVVVKCTAHSDGSKTNFRDWAKLTYMGEEVTGFRNMLEGYKSTSNIALGDANM